MGANIWHADEMLPMLIYFGWSHEGNMVVAESFEKRHADAFKLNDRYHIGYIPIVASLAFLARL
jgi:hypothetical protein